MKKEELVNFLETQLTFTIADVQRKFGLDYGTVRQVIKELEASGRLYLEKDVTFKWVVNKPILLEHQEFDDEDDDDFFDEDLEQVELNLDEFLKSLDERKTQPDRDKGLSEQETAQTIINKLKEFRINVEHQQTIVGASVTRYVFNVKSRTRLSQIKNFALDIESAINSQYPVRILADAENCVGIEVANKVREIVSLSEILQSQQFTKSKGQLDFALGSDLHRSNVVSDLATLPHLLVAGTTGAGKSCVLHNLIVSLATKYSPDHVRFLMVDPKFVELSIYNGLPHMLTGDTITNEIDAIAAMDYLLNELESRYALMRQTDVRNIVEYNAKAKDKLPYIVFIVDELADIMFKNKNEFEIRLQRLSGKCRAAGIHIVLATQRPDVKTVTGVVKVNIPARIALKMISLFDSSTVIGTYGAEKLIGRGDMLYQDATSCELKRLQGAYMCYEDIRQTVEELKAKYPSKFDSEVKDKIFVYCKQQVVQDTDIELDPLCKQALRFWLEKNQGKASIASIQRNLGIGFNRAGRIMDSLQRIGYVEELDVNAPLSRPLRVLITLEELDKLFPDED